MKTNLLSISLSLLSLGIFAQEIPKHDKKTFVSPDGKIYVNKELPVYLHLSTSADANAEKIKLNSVETAKYANPFFFDTEGLNTIRSPWAVDPKTKQSVPNQDVIFEVYADSKPPVTKIVYGNAKVYNKNGIHFISGNFEITLNAKDETSGIQKTYISIDGNAYSEYAGALKLDQEKIYTIQYFSVDNVGNIESVNKAQIGIDKSAPKTTLNIRGDKSENIVSARSSITFESIDSTGIEKIMYKINDNPERVYTAPISANIFAQGDVSITFYAIDKVQNIETKQTYDLYIDKTPPTIMEEIIGNSFMSNGKEYSSGRSRLKLTAFDNKAGIKEIYYSINGAEYKLYDAPINLSTSGDLAIKTYAIDNVNNRTSSGQQEAASTKIPYIDLTGPTVNYKLLGANFLVSTKQYISAKTKISLSGYDAESGINRLEYAINNGSTMPYIEPFSINNEGNYEVKITGYDNVDNTNFKVFSIIVDTTGPEINKQFSTNSDGEKTLEDNTKTPTYPSHALIFLSATDKLSGLDNILYSINNLPFIPYNDKIQNLKANQSFNIKVKAKDKLGNTTEDAFHFYIQ